MATSATATATATDSAAQEATDYYSSLSTGGGGAGGFAFSQKFKDLKDESNQATFFRLLRRPATLNFVLDFGVEEVRCAEDVGADAVRELLKAKV